VFHKCRHGALYYQALVVSKDCNVRAFGHQLNIVTMKGKDSTTSDFDLTGYVTAFLFFTRLDSERSTGRQLQRIVIVLAGGDFMLNHVTANFVKFATEFFGPSEAGSRGQHIWRRLFPGVRRGAVESNQENHLYPDQRNSFPPTQIKVKQCHRIAQLPQRMSTTRRGSI
jgi:hypothetical protein